MSLIIREFTSTDSLTKKITRSEAYSDDEGLTWRWVSNGSPIMLDVCRDYGIPCDPAAQEKAREEYIDGFLADYKKNQPVVPSAEEQYEMRAAFGPGQTVVDVVTGRKFKT